ncbi:MAG: cation:dicarboxylase symporter family transporter [Eubacterium sp.]|nr:cation:dicarboxylase symporter family transporter [Eubacterium sp.]
MSLIKPNTIEIAAAQENLGEAKSFIEKKLKRAKISGEIQSETLLVFDALLCNLLRQGCDENKTLTIQTNNSFGEIDISLGFEGEQFVPIIDENGNPTAQDKILTEYEDKLDCSYQNGYNTVHIVVQRSFQNTLLASLASIILAVLVYIPINAYMSSGAQAELSKQIVFPLIKLFSNAMLMIGAPVTFFSLLKNLTDIYVISKKNSDGRKLQAKTLITSVIAVVLAIVSGLIIASILSADLGELAGAGGLKAAPSLPELIESMVPSSIFVPFETIMPFPLIFVALIVTYAFCTVGKYFDKIKSAVDACYTLFSRMLHVVMSAFPFFCFLALLYPLLDGGFANLLVIFYIIGLSAASLVILAAFYLIRLIVGGVKLKPFFRHLPTFLKENYKIGSVIDAVPFNIRYCVKNYGMQRSRITNKFTILAQINLDGNCYLIMLMGMLFIFMMVSKASWFYIVVIAIMVVFLSLGAPNQPGSVLVGTLIIALYLKADVLIPTAIYLEVFFGAIQNLINVTGDMVTVAIEEKHVFK